MGHYSLSAIGSDRPGIVAAVSGVLVDLGCNLEDSSMTILRGHFAILLALSTPEGVGARDLEEALAPVARTFGLTVGVRDMPDGTGTHGSARPAGDAWAISVHGADRPGIVHAVTSALAQAGGNVVDLGTHLIGEQGDRVYVMTIRAILPPGGEGEAAAQAVRSAASAVGVHCTVHLDQADVL